jgi:GT2 family glycosyltransferase
VKITAYVPCHNNESTLPEVLAALRAQTRPADQLLFIHDRCTDRSPAIAEQHGFTLYEQRERGGLAAGRNLALAHAAGDVLLGVDADVVLEPNYLAELERTYQDRPEIAAVGGRLQERYTDTPADLWRAVHMPQQYGEHELVDPRILFGATTSGRVEALRQVGGWDDRYLTNYEDVDLSTRLKAAGLHLLYAPRCRAWHLRRDSLDSVLRGIWNWNYFGFERCFADAAAWLTHRAATIWARYRLCRVEDLNHPPLTYISLLLPWSWTVRDLNALAKTVPDVGDLGQVAQLARDVLSYYGYDGDLVGRAAEWLGQLAVGQTNAARCAGPLRPDVLAHVRFGALESIPDMNYVRRCRAS